MRLRIRAAIGCSATFLWTGGAAAQNMRDVPLGGRTATMGGAGVAAGIDAAMPYLNPAGIAGTPNDVLSLSADVYSYAQADVDHYFVPTNLNAKIADASISVDRYSARQLVSTPSGLSYFKRLGNEQSLLRHVLALSVIATSYSQVDINGSFRGDGPQSRLNSDVLGQQTYRNFFAGPSYAVSIGDRLRFGVSAFLSYTDAIADSAEVNLISQKSASGVETPYSINNRQTFDTYSIGASVIAGMQLKVTQELSFGAAFESRGTPLKHGGTLNVIRDSVTPGPLDAQVVSHTNVSGTFKEASASRPFRFSLGAAYDKPNVFTLAGDVHWSPPTQDSHILSFDVDTINGTTGAPVATGNVQRTVNIGTRSLWNVSLGGELHLSEDYAVRVGYQSDFDAVQDRTSDGSRDSDRLDWHVFTLGLGVKDRRLETTYGLAYRLGVGKAFRQDQFGPDINAYIEVPYKAHGVMIILSGVVRTDDPAPKDLEAPKRPADAPAPMTETPPSKAPVPGSVQAPVPAPAAASNPGSIPSSVPSADPGSAPSPVPSSVPVPAPGPAGAPGGNGPAAPPGTPVPGGDTPTATPPPLNRPVSAPP
ncbi:MAG: hypothetical protein NVSMB1_02660 [Polyangiales bacterium]